MDADRLMARLQGLDADVEPRLDFVEDLHDELAARLGFATGEGIGTVPRVARRRAGRAVVVRRFAILAAAALLLAALLANAATIGALVDRLLHPSSLLEDAMSAGVVQVAVSPDAPQVQTVRGMDGFDIDVAGALAARLGVRSEVRVTTAAEMLAAPGSGWLVAMPGIGIDPAATTGLLVTRPYYRWPAYLVTVAGSSSEGGLAPDATVCVVAGSPGAAWANGSASGPALEVRRTKPPRTVDVEPDETTCLRRVVAGEADAMVTTTLLPSDLQTSRDFVLIDAEPVAVEPRVIAVPAVRGAPPLRDALDRAIADLQADGTLADFARTRFGTDVIVRNP